jgi:tetratricopeptide (TPR) repeat protein
MKTVPIAAAFSSAKYAVGKNLRRLGLEYSRDASAQMWRERADRFAACGRIEEAIDCRRKAVEFDPTNKYLRAELAREFVCAGRNDEIRDEAGWTALGCALSTAAPARLAEAESAFHAALTHSSDYADALLGLSECLARQKRLGEAQAIRDVWFQRWITEPESDQLRRRQLAACRREIPAIMLVAMMKSASEFIRENIKRALDVPEITLSIGMIPQDRIAPSAVRQLALGGAIARSHMSANNLLDLIANGVDRLILHIRDPRQVTVSWVHFMTRISAADFLSSISTYDPPVPIEFRDWGFPQQLDWAAQHYLPGQIQWLEDWMAALAAGPRIPILVSKFEDFARDKQAFFAGISDFLGVSAINVPAAYRQSAAAMRNFRSGSTDEWRDVMSPEQIGRYESRLAPLLQYFDW